MTTQLSPLPIQRFYDNNNVPLSGGQLYTYRAGTTTLQPTYTDFTGVTPNTNPVVMNARGEANVWLTPGQSYKFVLKDASAVTIWTVDQINATTNFAVNVKNFGAAGDGSTDDTVAIQAAITAAGAQPFGGTVYFPDGQYKVSSTLTVARAGVCLSGASRDSVQLVRSSAFGPLVAFTTGTVSILDGVGINQMRLIDNGTNNASGTAILCDNVSRFTASDITIFGGTNGLVMKATSNAQISDIYMYMQNVAAASTGRYGVQITNTAIAGAPTAFGSNIYLTNVAIYGGDNTGATYSNLDDCLRVEAVDGLWVTGCYFGGAAVADFHVAHTNATYTCGDIFCVNNMMDICRGNGVLIDGTQLCQQMLFDGIVSCTNVGVAGKDGIYIAGPIDRVVFRGSIYGWKGAGLHFGTTAGIVCSNVNVSGMNITGNLGFGVQIETNSGLNQVSVTGNNLAGNTAGSLKDFSSSTTLKYLDGNLAYNVPWIGYTPTISSSGGAITAVASGLYRQIGSMVTVQVRIASVSADTGTGFVTFTLPSSPGAPVDIFSFAGSETNTNAASSARTQTGVLTATLTKYDGTYPSAVGRQFSITGSYQVA
jgi:hypothetical protein